MKDKLVFGAAQRGVSFEITQLISPKHLLCYWYGGEVAVAIKGNLRLSVMAAGDVIAELKDKHGECCCYSKDKGNNGRFYDEMHRYLGSDRKLLRTERNGRLVFYNNNWFEWTVYDTEKEKYIGPDAFDNIFDSDKITDCLDAAELGIIFEYALAWEADDG